MSTLTAAPAVRLAPRSRANKSYQMCTRCIMDTTDPDIGFDERGVCSHCTKYFQRAAKEVFTGTERQQRLDRMLDKIKREGANKEYDCLIGVSGGVDSTMVAYHVKHLGLRALALHLDNGWDSELAVDNIKKTLQKLDIDLCTYVIDWEEFRNLQLSFLKASVPNCEIPTDHAISALLIRTALKRRIRFILTGSNLATEGIMPVSWGYHNQDLRHVKAIHRRFGAMRLTTFPKLSLSRFLYAALLRGVKFIPFLNYFDYNKSEAKKLVQEELGWRDYGGKHYESIYTRFFQGYILPRKFGYDKRRAHLSTLVCSAQITREEALADMAKEVYAGADLEQDREFVIKKLGLTEAEFEAIMNDAVKRHTDYPSFHYIYEDWGGLKQVFKRIATRA